MAPGRAYKGDYTTVQANSDRWDVQVGCTGPAGGWRPRAHLVVGRGLRCRYLERDPWGLPTSTAPELRPASAPGRTRGEPLDCYPVDSTVPVLLVTPLKVAYTCPSP